MTGQRWNLDAHNPDAITLWHSDFLLGLPVEPHPPPEPWGQRLLKVLCSTLGWRSLLPRREKTDPQN